MTQHEADVPPFANVSDDGAADALKLFAGGAELRALHGVSDDMLENLYAFAYRFYQERKLSEAETFFRFLLMYDLSNPDYPFGLAAVYQSRKEYAKAVEFYALAFAQSKNDYRPMFHAGQCYLMMGRRGRARRCFESVIKAGGDSELGALARGYLLQLQRWRNAAGPDAEAAEAAEAANDEADGLALGPECSLTEPRGGQDGTALSGQATGNSADPAVDPSSNAGSGDAERSPGEATTGGGTLPGARLPNERIAVDATGENWTLAKATLGMSRANARSG